jgi:ceramide glucosyltransferase
MHLVLSIVFCLFAAILTFLSYKSLRGGINYLNYFKRELSKSQSNYTPFASIIAPCRGVDDDLEKNLSALFAQNYPNYEVIFVVDSENDKSTPIIQNLLDSRLKTQDSRLIIAEKAENEGQKVHNLRKAVRHVSDESGVFVFVDSDARPNENWLRSLVAPLENEEIGCASGYRWFVQKRGGFATHLRSVWNASVASALGANMKSNFCWGGATAIRRETFEKIDIREKWHGTLSDDFAVTRAMHEAKMPIYFVPQALTATVEDCSFKELFEFTTRQIKITRVYAQHLWVNLFIGSSLFVLVWIWGIFILLFNPLNSFIFWFAAISLSLIFAFSTGKSYLRLEAVKLVLKNYEKELRRQFVPQNILWIITPAIFLHNCFCALISRRIIWRGITYILHSPNSTEILLNDRK